MARSLTQGASEGPASSINISKRTVSVERRRHDSPNRQKAAFGVSEDIAKAGATASGRPGRLSQKNIKSSVSIKARLRTDFLISLTKEDVSS
ncbi:hypothetical protein EYF80_008966 [Liparis tanakae]|uniref:Uncharacterized protein n=1 Tax=Liparis tanakae TaxID=230148 RepID=A0A4Z2ITU6_9TELE|nr:hypothetical protein EYF80_008966 [Liparis tanakae]